MIKKYQVTIIDNSGAYRPISCIVNNKQSDDIDWTLNQKTKKDIQQAGIIKICQKKYWSIQDIKKYNYTRCKIRAVE